MGFLSLEKFVETAPTERAELESTSTLGFEKNPEKSKETQIRVKSYDSPNSLHHEEIIDEAWSLYVGNLNEKPRY